MVRANGCWIAVAAIVMFGGGGVLWWSTAVARPERLNDELAAAIGRRDVRAVQSLLRQGAKADAWRRGGPDTLDSGAYQPMLLLAIPDVGGVGTSQLRMSTTGVAPAGAGSEPTRRPDMEIIRLLLEHGADANRGNDATSPLGAAAAAGSLDAVRLLVAHGARVNARPRDGCPAIACAQTPATCEELLRLGADVNAPGSDGRTPIACAIAAANAPVVRCLLHHGANLRGQGLVAAAVSANSEEIVRVLLDAGADASERDRTGVRPLDYAATGQPGSHLKDLLLRYGAK